MNAEIYLDPEETAKLEPSDGDAGNRSWIAPFAVPTGVKVGLTVDKRITELDFGYHDIDKAARKPEQLAIGIDHPIFIETSAVTGTVLRVRFEVPIPAEADSIQWVASQIGRCSRDVTPKAKEFSFRMVSRVLEAWAERIASGAKAFRIETVQ